MLILIVAALAFAYGRWATPWVGAAGTAALFAGVAAGGDGVVPIAIATAGPWLAGRVLRSHQRLLDSLTDRTRELEAERDALARRSAGRERARIARELHDIVAHHLAVIVVQAGAGRMAADEDAGRLARIHRAGEEALAELGRLVDLLGPEPAGGWLEALLEHAAAAGVTLRADGVADVPPGLEPLAHRVVQEGLTNVMKHAPGAEVAVRVAVAGSALEIELRDAHGGPPGSLARAGAGLGLAGLRERVEAAGGTLDAGPDGDDGWRLQVYLPGMTRSSPPGATTRVAGTG